MNSMSTDVSALDAIQPHHFDYNDFSADYATGVYNQLKDLANRFKNGTEPTYSDTCLVKKLLVNAKILLDIDRQQDVHITCFYHKHFNAIAKKFSENEVQGVVDYFYPPVVTLTESEEKVKLDLYDLLGIKP